MRLAAGTVVTPDYLPWARAMFRSFGEQHPDARQSLLVLGELPDGALRPEDRFEVLHIGDVGLSDLEYGWMRLIYTNPELCWSVKPWLLTRMLEDCDAALYIDSDVCVYDSMEGFAQLAVDHGVALSPHSLTPREVPNLPSDEDLIRRGLFNAGLVAVGPAGTPFLEWWKTKLARQCQDFDPNDPLHFADQKWLDLVVGYFPCGVTRDPGINLARWNLFQRELELRDGRFIVDGTPVRLFHFSEFSPDNPTKMRSLERPHPRTDPAQSPPLRALLEDFAQRMLAAGWQPREGTPEPPRLGGIELSKPVKKAIRTALIETERNGLAPSAALPTHDHVRTWLRAPVSPGGLSWYLWGLLATNADVRATFPRALGEDEQRYLAWSRAEGVALGLVPAELAGPATPVALNDARRFVALVDLAEVLSEPDLLAGLSSQFNATDEVTLLLRAPGASAESLMAAIEPQLAAHGLDGPDAPDLLAFIDPVIPALLAPHVRAVLSRRPAHPALAHLPAVPDATQLRALADACLN